MCSTITKSISILNDGVGTAGIGVSSGNAITINAGANDSVHLRGLTIEGLRSGTNGIQFNAGGNLAIENCVIRNFAGNAINLAPSTSSSFSVSNTIASNNSGLGISVQPTGAAFVKGVLSKVMANNNNDDGILVGGSGGQVVIVDSEASNNGRTGVTAAGGALGIDVMLRNVVASYNGTGLSAGKITTIRVAHSVVTGNGTGVAVATFFASAVIGSYGDNDIDGNTNNNTGVLTSLAMH